MTELFIFLDQPFSQQDALAMVFLVCIIVLIAGLFEKPKKDDEE